MLPLTERSWRAWRREHGEWLQECEKWVAEYHKFILSDAPKSAMESIKQNWPLVPMPGGVPYNLFAVRLEEQGMSQVENFHLVASASNATTAFAAYRQSKAVYRIEPRLWADLSRSKLPTQYPMEHFVLPRNGMAIETEFEGEEIAIIANLDLASSREHMGELEARFSVVNAQNLGQIQFFAALNLSEETLGDAWNGFLLSADSHAAAKGFDVRALETLQGKEQEILGAVINSILYILNDEDVVKSVHPGTKPEKTSKNPEKARKFQDIKDPDKYNVGREYVAVIEHWENEQGHESESVGSGRQVRPHMRAAHAHLYWTGKGREVPKVRYLPPIPVKGGRTPGDEDEPRVTKVK